MLRNCSRLGITRGGKLVMSWGDPEKTYDLKSTTKSIGVTALGLAIADGRIALTDLVTKHHPTFAVPSDANSKTGWIDQITIQHLATQTAGFEKPGGYTKLIFEPGTKWAYSDGGPNWLAECVTLTYGRDVDALMFERVFTPLGITRKDLVWRSNSYRSQEISGIARREFGSGISASVDAMARIGLLYLNEGRWNGKQIIPAAFVEQAGRTVESVIGIPEVDPENYGNASDHYGLLWWNNADGTLKGVPRDAFWSWGLHDSLIVIIPSLDIVIARAGQSWKRDWDGHYDVLKPFLEPIVAAAQKDEDSNVCSDALDQSATASSVRLPDAPYPPSSIITGIAWAPAASIVRKAKGGDNWPMTWADDDHLYTAYGDGHGFEPFVEKKLSMGLCQVSGGPADFQGINVRSSDVERTGGGANGAKASGILMVDGVLYLLVRNTANSQLAWSRDHGRSWTWADWKFTSSFGCPTFLNFGRNYDGARDSFVYVVSHDSDSAYKPADGMVLARVPKASITQQSQYEFFAGLNVDSEPVWTADVTLRQPVMTHRGRCYRSGLSYNAPLKRYLWSKIIPGGETRFAGGFAIYDAPEPWGPWTTVFFTEKWDVGPGETSSIPTKWISPDGRDIHLVFSGDDCFSVRRGRLTVTVDQAR
jgi:hypothetical protein